MMMFRRLYWVAEQVEVDGTSQVTGIYTSIQDLIQKGLHWCKGDGKSASYRLTLVKPDSFNCPLGVWQSPDFAGMNEALEQFVSSNEYTREECLFLQSELASFMAGEVKA
jgi:hypothetical protein